MKGGIFYVKQENVIRPQPQDPRKVQKRKRRRQVGRLQRALQKLRQAVRLRAQLQGKAPAGHLLIH